MATSHPYISGPKNIAQMVMHLRKSFPVKLNSETVKKLGIAPKNESYVINALQFIGLLDQEGNKTEKAKSVFSHHKDTEFASSFSEIVKEAYSTLFDLHGSEAWNLSGDDLITFFRQSDHTSDAIGRRQASTFKIFAGLAGHGDIPELKNGKVKPITPNKRHSEKKVQEKKGDSNSRIELASSKPIEIKQPKSAPSGFNSKDFALTVRVEINLPTDATKETYDNIFKSIKENLIDA